MTLYRSKLVVSPFSCLAIEILLGIPRASRCLWLCLLLLSRPTLVALLRANGSLFRFFDFRLDPLENTQTLSVITRVWSLRRASRAVRAIHDHRVHRSSIALIQIGDDVLQINTALTYPQGVLRSLHFISLRAK